MRSHVHFGAIVISGTPAPGQPANVQAFRLGHDMLVRDFFCSASSYRRKFAYHKRQLQFHGLFKGRGNAFLNGSKTRTGRVVLFAGPPHMDGKNQIMFRVSLQKFRTHGKEYLFVLAPHVGIDHDGHADSGGTHLGHDHMVHIKKFAFGNLPISRFVAHIEYHVFLVI